MMNTTHAPLMSLRYGAPAVRQRPTPRPVAVSRLDAPLPLQERESILKAALAQTLNQDAQLESHTATVAVVVYQEGSRNRVAQLLVTLMRRGLGVFVRTAPSGNTKSSRVMMTVDEYGNIAQRAIPR